MPLPRSFYGAGAEQTAARLLGQVLLRRWPDGSVQRARITETEAYVGEHDLASHARFGRTRRNASMYARPGTAYVYLVYGMHHCLNVACSTEGDPQAVLLRAAEPLDGWTARLSGPALLADAFGLDRSFDGCDLVAGPLSIEEGIPPPAYLRDARVGVAYAGEWAARPLRFLAEGGPWSRPPAGLGAGRAGSGGLSRKAPVKRSDG